MSLYNSPGIYVSTSAGDVRPVALQPFKFAYLVGYSVTGVRNIPTLVTSLQDFVNNFGASSASIPSVRLYFQNNPTGIMLFINTAISAQTTFEMGLTSSTDLTVGVKTVTINGQPISITIGGAGQTPTASAVALKTAIEANTLLAPSVSVTTATNEVVVRQINPAQTLTISDLPSLLSLSNVSASSVIVDIGQPVANAVSNIKILGELVSVDAGATPTVSSVRTALITEINDDAGLVDKVIATEGVEANQVLITSLESEFTLGTTAVIKEISAFVTTPNYPRVVDIGYSLDNLDPELIPGFIFAPEFFQYNEFTGSQRQSIAVLMDGFASGDTRNWFSIIDCGNKTQVPTYVHAMAEADLLVSAQGHSAYYYPYFVDVYDVEVPPSAGVASIAVRKYTQGGFSQPPAGVQNPVKGVKGLAIPTSFQEQEIASTKQVNFLRVIPNNGVCIFDDLTLSNDVLFSAINTRIILNILVHTLKGQFLQFLFQSIDGTGQYFSSLQATATHTLEAMRTAGLLYGSSSNAAYKIDINRSSVSNLEAGIVDMKIYVVPSPRARQILINVIRTAIGSIPSIALQLGDPNAAQTSAAVPTPQVGSPGATP